MMNKKEFLEINIGKNVKLEKLNGFVLHGIIESVSEDFIIFKTNQTSSLMHLASIRAIVPRT